MPPTSSLGAAAPKTKTINVEVNLLAEWLEKRARLREERLRWTAILVSVLLISVAAVPWLADRASEQSARLAKAAGFAKQKAEALALLEKQLAAAQPKIDSEDRLKLCQQHADTFMAQMLAVLSAKDPKMAVEMIECSVLGGEMTIRAKSVAETYATAQSYVERAGQGTNVLSAILSSARQNPEMGSDGVTFELTKKVKVGL